MKRLETSLGTASGMLLSTLPLIGGAELLRTVVLAALGAVVSFGVSCLLQWLRRRK